MARFIHKSRKKRLSKLGEQRKWAPFWIIPKVFGIGRRVHPSRLTKTKRNWKRTKTKA